MVMLHNTGDRPRCVVLGLDGLPLSLARRLAEWGTCPNLERLLAAPEGGCFSLRAELPELSPVNWTSFYTASGPEEHGVFGFTRISGQDYSMAIADSSCVGVPSIFDRLGVRGLVSKVVNLPNTYPAKPINGMLVAGFVAPDLAGAVFPKFLAAPLASAGYKLEADTSRGKEDFDFLLSELRATLASREAALNMFWPDLAWDLFVFVLTETDRLFHFQYPAVATPDHRLHGACMDFLREWDMLIGKVLDQYEALPGPKRLLVLADHGFTNLRTEVDVNAWLKEQGLLRLDAGAGKTDNELDASGILPGTAAFALDPGRIYLHTRERFSRGQISPAEAPALRERIREGLMGLRFEGEPVLAAAHKAEELYPGPALALAPDLVLEPRPGFDLKAKFNREHVFGLHGRFGTHTAGDVFFYDSLGARPERVRDVGRFVLDFFNLPDRESEND